MTLVPTLAELEGTTVGQYQLEGCLGCGMHTAVYRASTPEGPACALKVVDRAVLGGEDLAERLAGEGGVLHRTGHARILPLREPVATEEMSGAAMPLMLAPTLRELMRGGRLDSELAWNLLNQIANSLQSAHQWGLTYRLLKPGNILVRNGRAYLTEFGITGRRVGAEALATSAAYLDGPQYLAPEQILDEDVDYRADVYAFAVLVFEFSTGTELYGDAPPWSVLERALNDPPPSAGERIRIPWEVDAVLQRALAKDPEQRHASVRDLMEDLAYPPRPNLRPAGSQVIVWAGADAPDPGTWMDAVPPGQGEAPPATGEMTVESLIDLLAGTEDEADRYEATEVVTVDSLIDVLSGTLGGDSDDERADPGLPGH